MIITKMGILRFRFLLLLLAGLILADGVITEFVVSCGLSSEANPLMQVFLNKGNLLSIKLLGCILSAVLLWDINRRNPQMAVKTAMVFLSLYTGIVYWNIAGIFIAGWWS